MSSKSRVISPCTAECMTGQMKRWLKARYHFNKVNRSWINCCLLQCRPSKWCPVRINNRHMLLLLLLLLLTSCLLLSKDVRLTQTTFLFFLNSVKYISIHSFSSTEVFFLVFQVIGNVACWTRSAVLTSELPDLPSLVCNRVVVQTNTALFSHAWSEMKLGHRDLKGSRKPLGQYLSRLTFHHFNSPAGNLTGGKSSVRVFSCGL